MIQYACTSPAHPYQNSAIGMRKTTGDHHRHAVLQEVLPPAFLGRYALYRPASPGPAACLRHAVLSHLNLSLGSHCPCGFESLRLLFKCISPKPGSGSVSVIASLYICWSRIPRALYGQSQPDSWVKNEYYGSGYFIRFLERTREGDIPKIRVEVLPWIRNSPQLYACSN